MNRTSQKELLGLRETAPLYVRNNTDKLVRAFCCIFIDKFINIVIFY